MGPYFFVHWWKLSCRQSRPQKGEEKTDSVNAFDGGIKFRFPINGSGFGPGGKFFGRRLAQVYGASATTNDTRIVTSNETIKTQRS